MGDYIDCMDEIQYEERVLERPSAVCSFKYISICKQFLLHLITSTFFVTQTLSQKVLQVNKVFFNFYIFSSDTAKNTT